VVRERFVIDVPDSDCSRPRVLKHVSSDGSIRRVEPKQGQDDCDCAHGPEEDGWYERVSTGLKPAKRIVVLSEGKGRSNEESYLIDYLKRHQPALAARIGAIQRVEIAHLFDGEIAAMGTALLAA
jgi:hypothetical protein